MKNIFIPTIKRTFMILCIWILSGVMSGIKAAPPAGQDFSIVVRNVVPVSAQVLEFDVFLTDLDNTQPFELASVQCGLTINPLIYAGGTLSAEILSGTSGLNDSQVPAGIGMVSGSGISMIRVAPAKAPGTGNGTLISAISPGTRIARIRLTSSVPFPAGSTADLAFLSGNTTLPFYATRVAMYQTGLNVQLNLNPGVNAFVNENPPLNLPFPEAFTVTGGGKYCQGSSGVTVGLSGSQTGVNYSLYRNDEVILPDVPGTGVAFDFAGYQPAGVYRVTGTNANGTTPMLGTVTSVMVATPAAEASNNGPVCEGSTLMLTGGPDPSASYTWIGPNGFSSIEQNPVIQPVTLQAAGMYRMTINNQDGCSASDSTLVTVYTRPVPTINGLAEVCEGSTGIAYSTEAFMTDYHWFVDRGTIIDGDQTSTIIVNWGTEGTGAVFVTYITPNGCEPESPAEKTVEIHPAPVNNLELVNVTIQNGQAACAAAGNAITVAGNGTTYTVYAGGVSRMAAGLKIYMYSGTRVFPGGYLSAVISGECMFCNNLKNDLVNNATSDPVIPDKDLPENGSDIRIWPNPAREFITVEWTSNAEVQEGEVIIYGLTGSQIARHSISANTPLQFDLTGTPPGLCLVRISSGGNEWVRKVVRQP